MNWWHILAAAIGAGVVGGAVGAVEHRWPIKNPTVKRWLFGLAAVGGAWLGRQLSPSTTPPDARPAAAEERLSSEAMKLFGNARVASIFVEEIGPILRDSTYKVWNESILRAQGPKADLLAAGAELAAKGTCRLAAPDLELLFRVKRALADHSQALCAKFWNGGVESRDLVAALTALPDADVHVWFQLSRKAMQLELKGDPSTQHVWPSEAQDAMERLEASLPWRERATFSQANEAGTAAPFETACGAFRILTTRLSILPNETQDVLRRTLTCPSLVNKDEAAEIAYLRNACEEKKGRACTHLAARYINGTGGLSKDLRSGHELFQRACDGGESLACANVAVELLKGGQAEISRGLDLLQKQCTDSTVEGCTALGVQYSAGHGVQRNPKRAAELFERGCDGGDPVGCVQLAARYAKGEGVKTDLEKALQLLRNACDAGEALGCSNLAAGYEDGVGVGKDTKTAAALYRRACSLGGREACVLAERVRENNANADPSRAGR